ncbi:phosphotransferase enzyme family protein [Streptomyces sp. NPDC008001]|uniref:phosphotransferase enzyme family protein n=1 Tax=Streptomyces sp. NPDC008001 TaxID=3364804 RepID=UPI0036EBE8E5
MDEKTDPSEIELTGGGTTQVVRVGETVRRTVRPWSGNVHRLLDHLNRAGIAGVPRWHGIDDSGREVLDYLPGTVGNYPLSADVRSEQALITAARLLRRLHDATADLAQTLGDGWQAPPIDPVEVICHSDFAPYNCVFEGQETVGVIDFDYARPGPRHWDLAYALYRFAPLTHPANEDGFGDLREQAQRAGLFLRSYGCTPAEGQAAVRTVAPRLQALVDLMRESAAGGDENFQRAIDEGHVDLYLRDIEYVQRNQDCLLEEVPCGEA